MLAVGEEEITDEYEFLLESAPGGSNDLEHFAKSPFFKPVQEHVVTNEGVWTSFPEASAPEKSIPSPWNPSTREYSTKVHLIEGLICPIAALNIIRDVFIIECLRPDRLQATAIFVQFQVDLATESAYALGAMVNDEVAPVTPLALVSVPRYDASHRVDNLVRDSGARCSSLLGRNSQVLGLGRGGSWF